MRGAGLIHAWIRAIRTDRAKSVDGFRGWIIPDPGRIPCTEWRLVGIAALALMPGSAAAQTMPPLDGCTPVYTVEHRACQITHLYRCEADGEIFWRLDEITGGVEPGTSVELRSADGDILGLWNKETGPVLLEMLENRDPFSVSDLRSEGFDVMDQRARMRYGRMPEMTVDLNAESRLTGERVEIDGTVFERTLTTGTMTMPQGVMALAAQEYLDTELGVMLTGDVETRLGQRSSTAPAEPVRIAREGDARFLAPFPILDCGEES